jgi:hypothetical protein
VKDTGIKLYDGIVSSRITTGVSDIDITSGYPKAQIVLNASKTTTVTEVCELDGLSEYQQRRTGVDMTACNMNAVNLGQSLFGLPKLKDLLEEFKAV